MKKDKKWLKNEISKNWLTINGVKIINPDRLNPLIDQLDEPQKVVVPKWFDEWVKKKANSGTDGLDLAFFMVKEYIKSGFTQDQDLYIKKHWRNILLAFANGYEVEEKEKEKLYWVRNKNGTALLFKSLNGNIDSSVGGIHIDEQTNKKEFYQFTEQEIKDYDERYWSFAVPVEEVEE